MTLINKDLHSSRRSAFHHLLLGSVTVALLGSSSAMADGRNNRPFEGAKKENWGVSVRNTIGSPVAELRYGMSSRFTPPSSPGSSGSGNLSKPPFGTGSLGIEVNALAGVATLEPQTPRTGPIEKVDFGNEVDFYGDRVGALNQVGFHVFQTGENMSAERGGPMNMPNIRFEINPDGPGTAFNYSTMVWVPGPSPTVNEWSPYIDATANGLWYFTGAYGATPPVCSQANPCTFAAAKAKATLSGATIYTVLVGKGRDNMWIGAVDGLRLNDSIYDFEVDGVKERNAKGGRGGHDDDDHDDDD